MSNIFKENGSSLRMGRIFNLLWECTSRQLVKNKYATILSGRGDGLINLDTYKQIRLSNMLCWPAMG